GSYVCRVYAAELPSTAAATPSAAAEEAKSKHFKSPTYLTIVINHTIIIINYASKRFFNITDKEDHPSADSSF
ncbi:MAG: hypothetical protein GY696_21000, partial [Gammaproteobacteria bacterium]|nr:hypothetical protein [Gammaproteobacteria bacterium]